MRRGKFQCQTARRVPFIAMPHKTANCVSTADGFCAILLPMTEEGGMMHGRKKKALCVGLLAHV